MSLLYRPVVAVLFKDIQKEVLSTLEMMFIMLGHCRSYSLVVSQF